MSEISSFLSGPLAEMGFHTEPLNPTILEIYLDRDVEEEIDQETGEVLMGRNDGLIRMGVQTENSDGPWLLATAVVLHPTRLLGWEEGYYDVILDLMLHHGWRRDPVRNYKNPKEWVFIKYFKEDGSSREYKQGTNNLGQELMKFIQEKVDQPITHNVNVPVVWAKNFTSKLGVTDSEILEKVEEFFQYMCEADSFHEEGPGIKPLRWILKDYQHEPSFERKVWEAASDRGVGLNLKILFSTPVPEKGTKTSAYGLRDFHSVTIFGKTIFCGVAFDDRRCRAQIKIPTHLWVSEFLTGPIDATAGQAVSKLHHLIVELSYLPDSPADIKDNDELRRKVVQAIRREFPIEVRKQVYKALVSNPDNLDSLPDSFLEAWVVPKGVKMKFQSSLMKSADVFNESLVHNLLSKEIQLLGKFDIPLGHGLHKGHSNIRGNIIKTFHQVMGEDIACFEVNQTLSLDPNGKDYAIQPGYKVEFYLNAFPREEESRLLQETIDAIEEGMIELGWTYIKAHLYDPKSDWHLALEKRFESNSKTSSIPGSEEAHTVKALLAKHYLIPAWTDSMTRGTVTHLRYSQDDKGCADFIVFRKRPEEGRAEYLQLSLKLYNGPQYSPSQEANEALETVEDELIGRGWKYFTDAGGELVTSILTWEPS